MTFSARTKRRILIGIGILVIVFFILTGLIPTTIGSTATVPAAQARAGRVITDPHKITRRTPLIDIRATVRAPRMSRAIARRLVAVGRPHTRISITGRGVNIVHGNATNGCAGTVVKTARVYIFQWVTLAWRRAIQAGWCWDAHKVTVVGRHFHESWKASGYCWSNQTWTNIQWAGYPGNPTQYRLLDAASVHVNMPLLGCNLAPLVDSFRYLREPIFYGIRGRYDFG
jgi:hypothetical protein